MQANGWHIREERKYFFIAANMIQSK